MAKFKALRRISDIWAFQKLRHKTRRFIKTEGCLIDENYVFIVNLPATDYYYLPYFQLYQYKNVIVNFSYVNSNKHIAGIIRKLSKDNVYKKYLEATYDSTKQYIIFFDGQYTLCSKEFRQVLNEKYPGCKIIFHLGDLIETKKGINIEDIKAFSDLTVTYDHNDAENYGLTYHPDPYSQLPSEMLLSSGPQSGVLFFGLAKNRGDDILGVYDVLKRNGVNCNFSIPDLNESDWRLRPELGSAHYTPYLEYLKIVQNSECLLEIIQKGSRGCTFRTWEAVVYKKKLITNNPSVREERFYNPKYIQIIETAEDISTDWLEEEIDVNYQFDKELSPQSCFKFYLESLSLL